MKEGLSFEAFAGKVGVCKQTLYNWRDTKREFQEAFDIAIEASRLWWERKGIDALHDKSINAVVWIYTMKCRFKDEWGDKLPEKSPDSFSAQDLKILVEHFNSLKATK